MVYDPKFYVQKIEKYIFSLYKFLVRPYLEYIVQFWSAHLGLWIDKIEKVQKE